MLYMLHPAPCDAAQNYDLFEPGTGVMRRDDDEFYMHVKRMAALTKILFLPRRSPISTQTNKTNEGPSDRQHL